MTHSSAKFPAVSVVARARDLARLVAATWGDMDGQRGRSRQECGEVCRLGRGPVAARLRAGAWAEQLEDDQQPGHREQGAAHHVGGKVRAAVEPGGRDGSDDEDGVASERPASALRLPWGGSTRTGAHRAAAAVLAGQRLRAAVGVRAGWAGPDGASRVATCPGAS